MCGFVGTELFLIYSHLLLQVSEHIQWNTPSNRSVEYVEAIGKELGANRIHLDANIQYVRRLEDHVDVILADGRVVNFTDVVFACHPYETIRLLGDGITAEEQATLSAFQYAPNDTYVHSDESLMPRAKAAWTSWNYMGYTHGQAKRPVFVTYWLNKLQSLPAHAPPIFVSLNPHKPPAPEKIYARINYAHPQYTVEAVKAQARVKALQGKQRTYYCGAYLGYGFHEDGFRSGIEAAMRISGHPVPWMRKLEEHSHQVMRQCSRPKTWLSKLADWVVKCYMRLYLANSQRISSIFSQISCGQLVLHPCNDRSSGMGMKGDDLYWRLQSGRSDDLEVTVRARDPRVFLHLLADGGEGLVRGYIQGGWDVVPSLRSRLSETLSDTTNESEEASEAKELAVTAHAGGKGSGILCGDDYQELTNLFSLFYQTSKEHGAKCKEDEGYDLQIIASAVMRQALAHILRAAGMNTTFTSTPNMSQVPTSLRLFALVSPMVS